MLECKGPSTQAKDVVSKKSSEVLGQDRVSRLSRYRFWKKIMMDGACGVTMEKNGSKWAIKLEGYFPVQLELSKGN